jgi:hypothetical protein
MMELKPELVRIHSVHPREQGMWAPAQKQAS